MIKAIIAWELILLKFATLIEDLGNRASFTVILRDNHFYLKEVIEFLLKVQESKVTFVFDEKILKNASNFEVWNSLTQYMNAKCTFDDGEWYYPTG